MPHAGKISCAASFFRVTINYMEKYTLIRQNRRTISMRLDKDGNITVFLPARLPAADADRFIEEHARWLARKRQELAARAPLPAIEGKEGEHVPFLGEEYVVRLWNKRRVFLGQGEIFLPENDPLKGLIRFYRRRLKEFLLPLVCSYAAKAGVSPQRLSVGSARTRWGSCSGGNALTFSFRLAMCAPFAVEYVVVHELCHILHKNHSPAFWQAVGTYFPAYREAKQYLRQKNYFMEIL